ACGQIQATTLTLKSLCAGSGSFTLCKATNAVTTLVAGTAATKLSALCFADSGSYVENGVHTTGAATLASNNAVTTGACGQIQATTLTVKNAGCAGSGSFTLCKTT